MNGMYKYSNKTNQYGVKHLFPLYLPSLHNYKVLEINRIKICLNLAHCWPSCETLVSSLQKYRTDKFKTDSLKIVLNLCLHQETSPQEYVYQLILSQVLPIFQKGDYANGDPK